MRRGRGLLAALALLVALAIGFAALREKGSLVRVSSATRGPLRVSVSCAGVLQPPPGGELRAPEAATVRRLLVQEGARVRRGDGLLELRDPELVSRERQAREEVLALEAETSSAAEEASRGRKEVERRRELLRADERLLQQGAIARSAYESSAAALREAEAGLVSSEARLRALRASGADPGSSPARLSLARSRAADIAGRVAALTLRAPADGVVYGLPRREGETVAEGQVVASVTDPDRPEVRVKVDQPDLPRIAEGQRILVSFDGLPDRRFEGTLRRVSLGLRESGGREVAEVLGSIGDPDHALPWNASVSVEVVVLERPSVVRVPRAALQRDGERRFVYVPEGGRARRREVKVGALATGDAEIESGLAEGDPVILSAAGLEDGARIRIAR